VLLKSGYGKDDIELAISQITKTEKKKIAPETKKATPEEKNTVPEEKKITEEKKTTTEEKKITEKTKTIKKQPIKKEQIILKVKKRKQGYFHQLARLLFDIDGFFDEIKEGEGFLKALSFYLRSFFLTLPLILCVALIYYGTFKNNPGDPVMDVLFALITFLVGTIGMFIIMTITKMIGLLVLHIMAYLVGSREGISKTYQAFFYAAVPAILFLWLIPLLPVFIVFVVYSIFIFYEALKRFHKFNSRQAIMSIVLCALIWMIIMIMLVLLLSPLLSLVTLKISTLSSYLC